MSGTPRRSGGAGLIALLALAFAWTFLCGERGFAPFRQSVVFDGGYRVLSGQVPFRDFIAPCGPVSFWVQAAFFAVLGVNSFAYLVASAAAAAFATWCAWVILRLLFPLQTGPAWVAGLLTAVWFYPQSGTPWIDQTAYVFVLVAFALLLAVVKGRWAGVWAGAALGGAGVAVALALLARQSAGLLALPICLALLPLGGRGATFTGARRTLGFLAGLLAALFAFGLWLVAVSDPAAFVRQFVDLPLDTAATRLGSGWVDLVATFVAGIGPLPIRIALVGAGGCALLVTALLLFGTLTGAKPEPAAWPPCVLGVGLLVFQYVQHIVTNEPAENGLPFLGLVLVLGAKSAELALIISRSTISALRFAASCLLILVLGTGAYTSWSRTVHPIFAHSSFPERSPIPGFRAFRWGTPMRFSGPYEFDAESIHSLVNELVRVDKPFFVFPDFTFLYGLAGKPSPQPLLWFEPGVTYAAGGDPRLADRIVRSLEEQGVEIILFENDSDPRFGTLERLEQFPRLLEWVSSRFDPKHELGSFWIWLKKGA